MVFADCPMPDVLKPSLNWLLPLTPIAIVLRFVAPEAHIWCSSWQA